MDFQAAEDKNKIATVKRNQQIGLDTALSQFHNRLCNFKQHVVAAMTGDNRVLCDRITGVSRTRAQL